MKYFISGHRNLGQELFNKYYVPEIERVLEKDPWCEFVIGDYEGVDLMAQNYLKDYPEKVTVYHMFTSPRNLASDEFRLRGGFKSDEERDAAMTSDSDQDIAYVLPGRRDSGTAQNIVRRREIKKE